MARKMTNTPEERHKKVTKKVPPVKLHMSYIKPRTIKQSAIFDAFKQGHHLLIFGTPGTGKTFVPLALALEEALAEDSQMPRVLIIRSMVQSREMGFLPGNQKEKVEAFEGAYINICAELFDRQDAYEKLKADGKVQFSSTSFLRGLTFRDCVVIVDECQNMADQELHTIMTRIGENCQVVFLGDIEQDDLTSERRREKSGFQAFMDLLKKLPSIRFFEMGIEDIQRSGLVREYLLLKAGYSPKS